MEHGSTPKTTAESSENSSDSHFRICKRFQRIGKPFYNFDQDKAIIYLKLRSEGCDKKKAVIFCAKEMCRADTTVKHDGPASCRILKPSFDPQYQNINGWQSQLRYKYDMGQKFYTSVKDFLHDGDTNNQLEERLTANENKVKDDFKMKINRLTHFYEELNQKYNYSSFPIPELLKKLKEIEIEARKFKTLPRKYLQVGRNLKLFELVEDFEIARGRAASLIDKMQAFPSFLDEEDIQIKYKSPLQLFDCRKKEQEEIFLIRNPMTPRLGDEQVASRTAAIGRLVRESRYVINIAQGEEHTPTHSENSRRDSVDSTRRNSFQPIYENFAEKIQMAEEFNKSNYVSPNRKRKGSNYQALKLTLPSNQFSSRPQSPSNANYSPSPSITKNGGSLFKPTSPEVTPVANTKVTKRTYLNKSMSGYQQDPVTESLQSLKSKDNWEAFRESINKFAEQQVNKINGNQRQFDNQQINTDNYEILTNNYSNLKAKVLSRCSSRRIQTTRNSSEHNLLFSRTGSTFCPSQMNSSRLRTNDPVMSEKVSLAEKSRRTSSITGKSRTQNNSPSTEKLSQIIFPKHEFKLDKDLRMMNSKKVIYPAVLKK